MNDENVNNESEIKHYMFSKLLIISLIVIFTMDVLIVVTS
jgi:hypothetical protein